MGREHQENQIEPSSDDIESFKNMQIVTAHIHKISNKRNMRAIALLASVLVGFIILTYYANHSLTSASGVFKVGTDNYTASIKSLPIVDSEHYFDDRVALVQSGATRNLTTLLTHTTVSYLKKDREWQKLATEAGRSDLITNLKHIKAHELMTNKDSLRMMTIKFIKGVPLVVKPHYPDGTSESDILDVERRNMLDVIKWTLQTEAEISVGDTKRDEKVKVAFNFDITPKENSYLPEHLMLTRMSLWEVVQ